MTEDLVRIPRRTRCRWSLLSLVPLTFVAALCPPSAARAQGVTTSTLAGIVTDSARIPVANANVLAVHVPSGTQYRAVTRGSSAYTLPNVRVGGRTGLPYRFSDSSRERVRMSSLRSARPSASISSSRAARRELPG